MPSFDDASGFALRINVLLAGRFGLLINVFRRHQCVVGHRLAERRRFGLDAVLINGWRGTEASAGFSAPRESFWLQGTMAGFPAAYFCIKALTR